MFNPIPTRIEDILNAPCQFAIPIYQRDYKWGTEEAQELIEDLKNYSGSDTETLFLGNLIFEKTKEQKTFVVDGQQRMTTIVLLLIACRTRAKELNLAGLVSAIQGKITFIDSTTAESQGCRLVASESIRDLFEFIAKDTWDGTFPSLIEKKQTKKQIKRQVKKLKPIYLYFLKEISDFGKEDLSSFLRAVYDSYVARIEVDSEVEALSIFERTNARGLDLEISDLLKNFLFIKKVEGIEAFWEQILDNSGGTILRMLKYFYVSKRGYVLKPELYKKLKGYGAEVGAQELTEELADFSLFYRIAKTPENTLTQTYFDAIGLTNISGDQPRYESITWSLQALKEFKIVQFCPVAFAAIECLLRNGGKANSSGSKVLVRMFEAFEKYHFINNMVCERAGNEIEKLYAVSSLAFAESDDFPQITQDLINALKAKLAKEDEFVAKFTEISYSADQIPLICYIFDRFNNCGLAPAQRVQIYNADPKILRRNHNIEHFLAQKPEDVQKLKGETLDAIDNIGNLLVIFFKTNSRLGNATPAKKMERLQGELSKEIQNLAYITEFIAQYSAYAAAWDAKTIKDRAKSMAVKAYREIWKID